MLETSTNYKLFKYSLIFDWSSVGWSLLKYISIKQTFNSSTWSAYITRIPLLDPRPFNARQENFLILQTLTWFEQKPGIENVLWLSRPFKWQSSMASLLATSKSDSRVLYLLSNFFKSFRKESVSEYSIFFVSLILAYRSIRRAVKNWFVIKWFTVLSANKGNVAVG